MTINGVRHTRRWTLLAALAVAVAASVAVPSMAAAERFAPGEVIVRYKSGTSATQRSTSRARAGVAFKRSLPIRGTQLASVQGSVNDAVARLNRQADVLYAQPNFIYHSTAAIPNDPRFGQLWGLRNVGQQINDSPPSQGTPGVDVRALGAWDFTRGAGAVVAIVDTGVDVTHPDLAGNAIGGADFVDGGTPNDDNNPTYHGTHVAGTAAANDNNVIGIAGVAPDARILPVRVLDSGGFGDSARVASGIQYAATHGATAINLSLGGPPEANDNLMSSAIDVANNRNAVVVAAAGNEGNDNDSNPTFPCNFPQANLICVAAVNDNGGLSNFSNYGPTTVDVGAPGESILSTLGGGSGDYHFLDGTSMAAPHVSGVAALVRRGAPLASDAQIVLAMKQSVHRLPSLGSGFTATGGIVDAAAAIRRARVLTTPPPPPPQPPAKASFRGSKRTIRVSRRGRFSFTFRAAPGLKGRIKLVTVKKVRPSKRGRKKRATLGSKTFTVPQSGKVKVKFKLSRRNRKILKRYKKLRISVSVRLRNAANLTSLAKVRITLKAPKRRKR
jgi:subtilisin family serine protease